MIVRQKTPMDYGYTPISELKGQHADMRMDFGILRLKAGEETTCNLPLERAWLLIEGEVEFSWDGKSHREARESFLDENPVVLHVPKSAVVTIKAYEESELAVERTENETVFTPVLYAKADIKSDVFGKGVLDETSIRTVRTVFDGNTAEYSNMVLGEVITHPGKWSSYPPHDHPHPEIYYYRFFPKQGFGISVLEEEPRLVKDRNASLVKPDQTHSQAAAPGYAMYYVWAIPHLEGDRWIPSTRYFRSEHDWMLEKDVKTWPELKYSKS